mmetsp:Transcript_30659/g.56719  ORF Transcript_30659/g.56719 Transcript_30659/m.56719 type:complete len:412 (-) Transcript_30659:76-1311(-)
MHVMKRAVQALCVASYFPWGAAGSRSAITTCTSGIIAGRTDLQSSSTLKLKHTSFASAARRSSLLAFAPPLPSGKSNQRGFATEKTMSSSSTDIQQIKNRVALLQLPVTSDKSQNIQTAKDYIQKAYEAGAQLCVLPEIWNSPYATSAFAEYAEVLPEVGDSLLDGDKANNWGLSSITLMEMAKSTNMYIVGGSIPETCSSKIYNTCLIVNPSGKIVGKHRKVHLFDINVPGGIQFKESETLTGGEGATYFDVEGGDDDDDESGFGRIGVGICYDIRFPEYALLLTQMRKCKILIYPGAFNLTTGPAHWELLQRARAVDGQCFVLTASPARMPPPPPEDDGKAKYPHYSAWGHSTVISPWGEVVATCDEKPGMVVADLEMDKVDEMRMGIPTMSQKRHDIYRLVEGDNAKE